MQAMVANLAETVSPPTVDALGALSTDLKVLVSVLEGAVNQEWVEALRSLRNEIESVYAVVLFQGRSVLTGEEVRDIRATLDRLRSLLADEPEANSGRTDLRGRGWEV